MAAINKRRVLIGALAGTVIWIAWSMVVEQGVLSKRYPAAQAAGLLLQNPRYSFFFFLWIVTLFLVSYVLAWLYANLRQTQGPGPKTALKLGLMVGFASGFPLSMTTASWSPLDRVFPAWWALELWVGACLSSVVAAWLYKE